eukprot:gene2960-12967_t
MADGGYEMDNPGSLAVQREPRPRNQADIVPSSFYSNFHSRLRWGHTDRGVDNGEWGRVPDLKVVKIWMSYGCGTCISS